MIPKPTMMATVAEGVPFPAAPTIFPLPADPYHIKQSKDWVKNLNHAFVLISTPSGTDGYVSFSAAHAETPAATTMTDTNQLILLQYAERLKKALLDCEHSPPLSSKHNIFNFQQ